MKRVRGCWECFWIGPKLPTGSRRGYESAGAVTVAIPLGLTYFGFLAVFALGRIGSTFGF